MDDLLREFVGESLDMMEAVAADLVAWESNPAARGDIDKIFRAVHTVKGSSGFFELPRVTALAHATEELLDALRSRVRAPDRQTVATILSAFDQIKQIIHAVATTGSEPAGNDGALLSSLTKDVRREDVVDLPLVLDADDVAAGAADPATSMGAVDDRHAPLDPHIPNEWRSVRVPLALLDSVMNGVSDLVLARNDVASALRAEGIDPDNVAAYERLSTLLGSVRASISQMRMVPLRHLFGPLPRIVRQVASELGKDVRLVSNGGEVEIDREVVEALRDPIVHVLRNAIDHGIEQPAIRTAAGKAAVANLRIDGRQAGNRIVISITDDGAGIAEQRLVERAVAAGHLTAEEGKALNSRAIANLIFLPGLSTAQAVTDISGRGVGMDVVKANVERLGGTIGIQSVEGVGVTIRLEVPMTLTIISALAIAVRGQEFALPRSAVEEVLLWSSDAVQRTHVGGTPMVRVRGQLHPLVVLEELLWGQGAEIAGGDDRALVLCRLAGRVALALEVPDVRDHAELVIKPLPPILSSSGLYNGFSLPDSGQPMMVLDVERIAAALHIDVTAERAADRDESSTERSRVAVDSSWLFFEQFGSKSLGALPMHSVGRLLDVPVRDVQHVGGRLIARIGETLVPVADPGNFVPSADGVVRAIMLNDGRSDLLFPVQNVMQLVALGGDIMTVEDDSQLLGVTMFDGRVVELFDAYKLFATFVQAGAGATGGDAATGNAGAASLHIVADQRRAWVEAFLRPSLRAAGYHVTIVSDVAELDPGQSPVIIVDHDEGASAADGDQQVIVRHADGPEDVVTAYDRAALLRILAGTPVDAVAPRRATRRKGSKHV